MRLVPAAAPPALRSGIARRPAAQRTPRSRSLGLSSRPVARALLLAALLAPGAARAECNGLPSPRWSVHQSLVLLLNPMGAEHNVRFGLCLPLYGTDDDALRGNHFEAGVTSYLSPIYGTGGGYVQVGPGSFLFVRAELSAIGIWPLPMAGAGYYGRAGYGDGYRQEDLVGSGQTAGGWTSRIIVVVRGRATIAERVAVLATSSLWLEHDDVGRAPFWVDVRDDVIAARSDWVFANEGVAAMAVAIPGGPEVRFGAYSSLRVVPASGYAGHQMGPLLTMAWSSLDPRVAAIDLFVRLGIYTHHAFREVTLGTMAGIAVDWDVAGL